MASDAWLTLLHAAPAADKRWLDALKRMGSPEALLGLSHHALTQYGFSVESVGALKSPDKAAIARSCAWLSGAQRVLVTFGGELYPSLLAEMPDAPLALWIEGANLALLDGPKLAMVGSRNPTSGGRDNAERFARHIAERGVTITSGLAIGIDGASHRGALEQVGGTIAVLGGGLDLIYPEAHSELARAIAVRGLLVSEYPPGAPALPYHFPQRNRIIAGLSLGTLVVEATRRSGSLITAKYANDYGREVFAIPGSIHNPLARGCHELIRGGAKLVEDAADIFVELAPQLKIDVATIRKTTSSDADSSPRIDDP